MSGPRGANARMADVEDTPTAQGESGIGPSEMLVLSDKRVPAVDARLALAAFDRRRAGSGRAFSWALVTDELDR